MVLLGLKAVSAPIKAGDVVVFCFHSVPSRKRFAEQMAALAAYGYPVLSMDEFGTWLSSAESFEKPGVLLTFDDGYLNQYENGVPVLQSFGFHAVFFVVSGYFGKHSGWKSEFGTTHVSDLALMDRNHLIELANMGYTVGCHTHTHPFLTKLSRGEVETELEDSKRSLEDLLGQPVRAFCYPYGDYDRGVVAAVKRAGFHLAFTVKRGTVKSGDDPYLLKRLPVLGEPSQREFEAYLSGTILVYWKLRGLK